MRSRSEYICTKYCTYITYDQSGVIVIVIPAGGSVTGYYAVSQHGDLYDVLVSILNFPSPLSGTPYTCFEMLFIFLAHLISLPRGLSLRKDSNGFVKLR